MIELVILEFLSQNLPCPIRLEHEPDLKGEYVIIEKTGSSASNHIRSSMLAIQSYGESMLNAAQLNEDVIRCMWDAVTLPEVSSVKLNSSYDFTDTATKEYRYQAVFDITHFEQEV